MLFVSKKKVEPLLTATAVILACCKNWTFIVVRSTAFIVRIQFQITIRPKHSSIRIKYVGKLSILRKCNINNICWTEKTLKVKPHKNTLY